MKGFAALSRSINPEAHARSLRVSVPLAKLSGRVAKLQLDSGRHFVAGHPHGSDLWELQEWIKIAQFPEVTKVRVDQCMAGLTGPRSGLLVKKPSEFWASDARLVRRLEPLRWPMRPAMH